MSKYENYIKDAPGSMSRFQIENFVIKTEPPSGRYHFCCQQIKFRVSCLESAESEEVKNNLLYEIEIFKEIADEYKKYIGDKSYEELQEKIWDETFTYKLAMSIVAQRDYGSLIPNILAMPKNCNCSKLLFWTIKSPHIGNKIAMTVLDVYGNIHFNEYEAVGNVVKSIEGHYSDICLD